MRTWGSLNLNSNTEEIYCPVRQKKVLARPEERVRVDLLNKMIHKLSFPMHLIAVEKKVDDLSAGPSPSDVRVDIAVLVCSSEKSEPIPLLIIECKAVPLTEETLRQVVGYNYYIRAPFIAVANENELRFGWSDPNGTFQTLDYLPPYENLVSVISTDVS